MYDKILEQLHTLEEEGYREFSSRLLPNITDVRGIRLPFLKKIAKDISKGDVFSYFHEVKHSFFEETLLMGFVIGAMDTKKHSMRSILDAIRVYVPYINNWSTCDSFCSSLKIAKKKPDEVFSLILTYAVRREETFLDLCKKEREYELRFFIVMCLNYYITDRYIDQVLASFRKIQTTSYYVNMALAWGYSKIFLSYPKQVYQLLEEGQSKAIENEFTTESRFVHNKTISKICDSYQVTAEVKVKIREYFISI